MKESKRGCVVVGSLPVHLRRAVETFVTNLGWPVILDGASGLRYRNIRHTVIAHKQLIQRPESELQLCTVIRIGHAFSNKWIDRNFLWKAKHRIAIDWTYTNPAPESNCNHILITKTIEDLRVDDKSHQNEFIEKIHSHNSRVMPVIQQVTSIEMNLMRALHTLIPEDLSLIHI